MATQEDLLLFQQLIRENRYDFTKLVYILFPFGQKDHPLEHMQPYEWQMRELAKISRHLSNPTTRYEAYRLVISSGNGAAKTAFGAMVFLMLMYTQRLRGRITANTDPQMKSIVWPEYDLWCGHARYFDVFFEKFGTSIKAKDPRMSEIWRLDAVTWNETTPASISGLHNKGGAIMYIFEEAAGIPGVIWKYAAGAFTETETIKFFLAFANSDDPESMFEQNMSSPLWHSLRIDTRTLKHIDPAQIRDWLTESNGDEDADDFRVRVRGLPRKTSKDSIIKLETVKAAITRRVDFDKTSVEILPCILTCDPAWTGGDETCISYRQGNYVCLLEKYKLDKAEGQTHQYTYSKLVYWEQRLKADAVFIDQGEGTTIYTLAQNAQKSSWQLIAFAGSPNDQPDSKQSEYHNIRAQMHYEFNKFLQAGGVLDAREPQWLETIEKQLCWTKGGRHKITAKKLAESKQDIKTRVMQSPDVSDSLILTVAQPVLERLPENEVGSERSERFRIGEGAYKMPDHPVSEIYEADYELYD